MARFYIDENFPRPVIAFLRAMGHDVLTAQEAGNANLGIPDFSEVCSEDFRPHYKPQFQRCLLSQPVTIAQF